MIKIEFPADRSDVALAIGQALMSIGGAGVQGNAQVDGQSHTDLPADTFGVADAIQTGEDEDASQPPADGKVDQKGVPFNAQLCANAKEPFYASGKDKGQWKCRKGVDRAQYDAWYASELGKMTANPSVPAEEPKVDLGAVWQQPANTQTVKTPSNPGELFAWVSEMQTAGRLTQADVDQAYPAVGLTVQQLWTAPPADQASMAAALFNALSKKAGA